MAKVHYRFLGEAEEQYEKQLKRVDRAVGRLAVPNKHFAIPSRMIDAHFHAGLEAYALGRTQVAFEHFKSTSYYKRIKYTLFAMSDGETLQVNIPEADETIELEAQAPMMDCSRNVFAKDLSLALVVGDTETVDVLLNFDNFYLSSGKAHLKGQPNPPPRPDIPTWISEVDLYKGLLTGDPDVADLLITALEESAVDETTDDEDYAYLMYDVSLPYATIAAILEGDHEGFVEAVVESNESHFEYYNSTELNQGDAPALINWKTAGMVQVAVDSGFPKPPSNPYLPEFEF